MPRHKKIRRNRAWAVKYSNTKNSSRVLVCLPTAMLEDVRRVADDFGISVAELYRRAVTAYMASKAPYSVQVGRVVAPPGMNVPPWATQFVPEGYDSLGE